MKIPQKIFSNTYVAELYNATNSQDGVKKYLADEFPYEEKFPKGEPVVEVEASLELKLQDASSNYDVENAAILHNAFSSLNETQASDARLWTYLTHVTFWKYMRKRWPLDSASSLKSSTEYVRSHYFIPTINTRSFLRNGISRLWWYAHLTFRSDLEEKYYLTKVMLQDLDRTAAILERNLGRNRNILFAFLEVLAERPTLTRENVRKMAMYLNLIGAVIVLPSLDKEGVKRLLIQKLSSGSF